MSRTTVVRRARDLLATRPMWAILALVCAVFLVIGSYHPSRPTAAQRIATLESILKCPSCADASLSQSETVGANELKATVARWVHEGMSDRAIEARLVAAYGPSELLRPSNPVVWIVPAVAVVAAAGLLGVYLARRRAPEVEVTAEEEQLIEALLRARTPAPSRGAEGGPGGG